MPNYQYRVCVRIADMLGEPDSSAVRDECSLCRRAVYFTMDQDVPEGFCGPNVCLRCLVAYPDLAVEADPAVLRMAGKSNYWADRTQAARMAALLAGPAS